jgi:type IV pilus assembly protein PilE
VDLNMTGNKTPTWHEIDSEPVLAVSICIGRKPRRARAGFTLVELMITVVIIGILAAMSYPGYTSHMKKTRRTDAQNALMQAASMQERFFTECNWYASSITAAKACGTNTTGALGSSATSLDGHYTLTVAAGPIDTTNCSAYTCGFTLTATPAAGGRQVGDGAFRLDSTGKRQWDKDNNLTYSSSEDTWKN